MPLKNPSNAHTPAPKQEPPTRGSQNAAARSTMSAGRAKGASIQRMDKPTARKTGVVSNSPQSAIHTACAARACRRAPCACATTVCTAMPRPESTSSTTNASQCTALTAATARVEMRPINQMSVRLSTSCTALLAISGNARATMAR